MGQVNVDDRSRSKCENCPVGHYWSNDLKTKDCTKCKVGRFQELEAQTSCELCSEGQYTFRTGDRQCHQCPKGRFSEKQGADSCEECPSIWWHSCPAGSKEAGINVVLVTLVCVVSGISVVVAIVLAVIKLKQLIARVHSIWKPQSEEDALLAKEFVLPKTSVEMTPSVDAFKACLENFVDNEGWSAEQQSTILEHHDVVVEYLGQRVEEAANPKARRIMHCCLEMDVLHDFKTLYDATMMNIRNKESEAFEEYNTIVPQLQAQCSVCPPNASDLMELYQTGRVAYPLFHAFIANAASASDSAYLFKSHNKQPGMKGLYRVLEKAVFKYNDNVKEDLDFGNVRDLVRGGIIDHKMDGLAKVAEYILNSTEVTVCRVKDRFSEPSPAGWTDLMVNFYLNRDPNKHVCEVQLIHFKMLSQRTTQEGHGAYNIFRVCAARFSCKCDPHVHHHAFFLSLVLPSCGCRLLRNCWNVRLERNR